jgi:hypothetical protein
MVYTFRQSVFITEYCTYSNEMKQKETFRLCASFLLNTLFTVRT